jgi:GNAT superfamily N-acetyltransferase
LASTVAGGCELRAQDVASARDGFRRRLPVDAQRPGFRAVLALVDDPIRGVAGFATAWTIPHPFRSDRAYGAVTARLGADLVGALEADELAVRPLARGSGLGRRPAGRRHRRLAARLAADQQPGQRRAGLLSTRGLDRATTRARW